MIASEHGVQAGRTNLSNCESRKVATPFYLAVTGVVRLQHVYRFDTPLLSNNISTLLRLVPDIRGRARGVAQADAATAIYRSLPKLVT